MIGTEAGISREKLQLIIITSGVGCEEKLRLAVVKIKRGNLLNDFEATSYSGPGLDDILDGKRKVVAKR